MSRQRALGQHLLRSEQIAGMMALEAGIVKSDVVFEFGTGHGMLTRHLCRMAGRVVSVDVDPRMVEGARARIGEAKNLTLKCQDGLNVKEPFTVFVSNLPYSRSRDVVQWLAQVPFRHGIMMVQKEFAEKLLAKASGRRAVSVIAAYAFDMKLISKVGRDNFDPPPDVDSVLLKIVRKRMLQAGQISTINMIFSYRRKTVRNILKQFCISSADGGRIDDMSAEQIVGLADRILGR